MNKTTKNKSGISKKTSKTPVRAVKLKSQSSHDSKKQKSQSVKEKAASKLLTKMSVSLKQKEDLKTPSPKKISLSDLKLKGSYQKPSTVGIVDKLNKSKVKKVISTSSTFVSEQISTLPHVEPNSHSSKVSAVAAAFAAHRASATSTASGPQNRQQVGKNVSIKFATQVRPLENVTISTPKDIAEKTAATRSVINTPKKPVNQRHGFKTNEFIVYPTHGVGRIIGIEEQEIAGMSLELFVINFEKEKLTLRVPTGKLESVGMRKLADEDIVKKAMDILKGRARIKRTMWSRRAQEYVAKINSGDLVSIAEVVRDLFRSEAQPEQSYSERQLYEDALDRMAREIAAVEKLDDRGAAQKITEVLSKSARGRRLAEEGNSEEIQAA
ncbi:MAG: CarD family transcriptional regulator [Hyphomicrobium sp.]